MESTLNKGGLRDATRDDKRIATAPLEMQNWEGGLTLTKAQDGQPEIPAGSSND